MRRLTCTLGLEDGHGGRFLCNAGPDLGVQLAKWLDAGRADSIDGVLLTDAELDHVLGLLALRQARTVRIWGTRSVRELLTESGLLPVLRCYTRVEWTDVGATPVQLSRADGEPSPLGVRPVAAGNGRLPRYAGGGLGRPDATVAWIVRDATTGRSAGLAPCLPRSDDLLARALGATDLAFVDGTFWDGDELSRTGRSSGTAAELGHPAVRDGFPARVARAGARVELTHLNNTNPALLPGSAERAELTASGVGVAEDDLEVDL
jgi:pyrroloquinoline quinone biosynthesis protein B